MVVIDLDPCFGHSTVEDCIARIKVIVCFGSANGRVGIVKRKDRTTTGFERKADCVDESAIIRYVIEDHIAGDEIKLVF